MISITHYTNTSKKDSLGHASSAELVDLKLKTPMKIMRANRGLCLSSKEDRTV